MTGEGKGHHPLPASGEARHGEIPESVEAEKGVGDDAEAMAQPGGCAVNPDGEPYRYGDAGRGEAAEFAEDQREHQDRGQSEVEAEADE